MAKLFRGSSTTVTGHGEAVYSTRRIAHNTLLLYGRMLITMWLNLWATRLTLQHLGVDDLGVFGVVGSVVSMFGVFTGGITTAVQRFITFEFGRGREGRVDRVFSTSLTLLLLFSAVIILMLEVTGPWLIGHWLRIPSQSLSAAQWVFQFTVVAFVFNVIAIPYNALVIAHERMSAFAAISILQVVLTCAAAWSLSLFAQGRLIAYGAAMAAIAIFVRLAYQVYCHRHFSESRFRWGIDRDMVGQLVRFAGVSTLTGVFQMLSGEGVILVINATFGVALNAVYAIALQLKNMVLSFALNLFKAIQPQITKTYAEGQLDAHRRLVYSGSKLEVYLILFLLLPFLCRTEQVLSLWLGQVPQFAVAFCRGIIFISLTYAAFEPLRTAVLATGQIARFMLIPDGFYLLVLPVSWVVAYLTDSPSLMLLSIVLMDVIACGLRIWLGAQVSAFSVRPFVAKVMARAIAVAVSGAMVCGLLSCVLPDTLWGLVLLLVFNSMALLVEIYLMGLDTAERSSLRRLVSARTSSS